MPGDEVEYIRHVFDYQIGRLFTRLVTYLIVQCLQRFFSEVFPAIHNQFFYERSYKLMQVVVSQCLTHQYWPLAFELHNLHVRKEHKCRGATHLVDADGHGEQFISHNVSSVPLHCQLDCYCRVAPAFSDSCNTQKSIYVSVYGHGFSR